MSKPALLIALAALLALPALAAINPEHYQRVASDQLRLRETARIVELAEVDGHQWRRVTLVAEVLEDTDEHSPTRIGTSIVIDYTVDLTERERLGDEFTKKNGRMPGPQFLHEPDPPTLDADGAFWANLAPARGRLGNVNRHAGRVVVMDARYLTSGPVFVPVAGQYSWQRPPQRSTKATGEPQ